MYCRNCLYPLTQLGGSRCAECGPPFEPTDPETYLDRRRRPSAALRTTLGVGGALLICGYGLALVGARVFEPLVTPGLLVAVAGLFTLAFVVAGGAGTAGRATCSPLERTYARRTAWTAAIVLLGLIFGVPLLYTLLSLT